MRHLRFSVAVNVLLVLSFFALCRLVLSPYLPKPPPNRLRDAFGEFLSRAKYQPVNWRLLGNAAIAEARQTGHPILLVIGTPWSQVARSIDETTFSDPEIALLINRQFVPVRVDGSEQPEWLGAFLPISRQNYGLSEGFQIWALTPDGTILDFLGRWRGLSAPDRDAVFQLLSRIPAIYEEKVLRDIVPVLDETQRADLKQIAEAELPNRTTARTYIAEADRLVVASKIARAYPQLLALMTSSGEVAKSSLRIQQLVESPLYDALDGGFFRASRGDEIEFDKLAVTNADLAELLAIQSNLDPQPVLRALATDQIASTLRTFRGQEGFAACQIGTQDERSRSPRYSFDRRRVSSSLKGSTADWCTSHLLSDVERSSSLSLRLASWETVADPKFRETRWALRAASPLTPMAGGGLLDHTANSAAALMRATMLTGDRGRMKEIGRIIDSLESFRRGDRVVHRHFPVTTPPYLGDYLAYADAMLADFQANGRYLSFENGTKVLLRAIEDFRFQAPGLYRLGLPTTGVNKFEVTVPELVDSHRASCSAQMLRLLNHYGRILSPSPVGERLRSLAAEVYSAGSALTLSNEPEVAGMWRARVAFEDPGCFFVVGPNSQALAMALVRRQPNRLVAQVVGDVRPDLVNRPPGIYIVGEMEPMGPFSVDKAAAALSVQLGTSP